MTSIYKTPEGKNIVINKYEDTLKKNELIDQGHFINTPFGQTFYLKAGTSSNTPILLIHGSSSNASMWLEEIKVLEKTHPVYALDIPGEPGKSSEERFSVENDDFSKWLKAVLDHLNLNKVILVGNSYGGWGAMNFATRHPDRVEKLILIATSGLSNIKAPFLLKAIFSGFQGKKGAMKLNQYVFGNDPIPEVAMEVMDLIMTHFSPRISNLSIYEDEELKNLTMPTLYIAGEDDVTVNTKKSAQRLTSNLKTVQINLIKNHGHVVHSTSKLIMDFLK